MFFQTWLEYFKKSSRIKGAKLKIATIFTFFLRKKSPTHFQISVFMEMMPMCIGR